MNMKYLLYIGGQEGKPGQEGNGVLGILSLIIQQQAPEQAPA